MTMNEQAKLHGLRRAKAAALGFLLGAAVVYVIARLNEDVAPWVSYVRAMAEAGMIGGLADWFAVTAVFRHPMGIPIPHTAIIQRKKDALGENLSNFVGSNFLAEDVVRDKLRRAEITARLGRWLTDPANADRVSAELATVARAIITVLRDEDVQAVLENSVVRHLIKREWGPPLGRLLEQLLIDKAHHKLVDLVSDRVYVWVRDNHATVLRVVRQRSPRWSPKFMDGLVADKIYSEALSFAWDVKIDPNHAMRKAVDAFLMEFARDLRSDPNTIARTEVIKQQLLNHPEVQNLVGSVWSTTKKMILDAAEDPASELRLRMRVGLVALGQRLIGDQQLRSKVDTWLERGAEYVVSNYRAEITTLITDTVQRWDAEETSRKVELQVGRDLQFIRINGTLVGALVGLLIHTVSEAFL